MLRATEENLKSLGEGIILVIKDKKIITVINNQDSDYNPYNVLGSGNIYSINGLFTYGILTNDCFLIHSDNLKLPLND